MKKWWIILFSAIVVLVSLAWIFRPASEPAATSPEGEQPVVEGKRADFYRIYLNTPANPLAVGLLPDNGAPIQDKPSLLETLGGKFNPEFLEKYEGSYTLGELRDGSGSSGFNLNSSWFIWNKNIPQAGAKIRKNLATGKYELIGARVALPKGGLGVSYEDDKETGDSRAYLDVKRDF